MNSHPMWKQTHTKSIPENTKRSTLIPISHVATCENIWQAFGAYLPYK